MPATIPFINQDNARELASKSHVARRNNQLAASLPAPDLQEVKQIADDYTARRIAVTRKQIRQMDSQLESCVEPRDFKAICDALARLHEIERQLSGRPLPGTLKPSQPKRTSASLNYSQPVPLDESSKESIISPLTVPAPPPPTQGN